MSKLADKIAAFWTCVQESLFPMIARAVPEPLPPSLYDVIVILELLRVEELLRRVEGHGAVGAPPADRAPLLRAYIAQSVLKISTGKGLHERLQVDGALRRICGWDAPSPPPRPAQRGATRAGAPVQARRAGKRRHARRAVPSLSTFSRAFAEFAQARVLDLVHAQRVQEYLGDQLWAHGAYDGTAIHAWERPTPPPTPAEPPAAKPKGRPTKGEVRPAPPPTRLQQQRRTNALDVVLAELPTACDKSGKKNSKGDTEWWTGYKMHLLTVEGDIPVAALTTSASMHDSGAAIPLMRLAAQRGLTVCYGLFDAAYDAEEIRAEAAVQGQVPIIAPNVRSAAQKADRERLARLDFSRLDVERALVEPDRRRRFKARTAAERVNARLKDATALREVRLRGHPKVHAVLMCRVLVIFAQALLGG